MISAMPRRPLRFEALPDPVRGSNRLPCSLELDKNTVKFANEERVRDEKHVKRSVHRILTSHAGSLPRPPSLIEVNQAKLEGRALDEKTYEERLCQAVSDVARKQAELGSTSLMTASSVRSLVALSITARGRAMPGRGSKAGSPAKRAPYRRSPAAATGIGKSCRFDLTTPATAYDERDRRDFRSFHSAAARGPT